MEKRRHGDTEKRRNGEAVTQNKNANRFLRITLYAFTHYTQPIFGANAPPTQPTTFYALRFTHHASRPIFQNRQFCRQIGQIPHHESRFRWLSNDPRSRNNIVAEKINPPNL